MDFLAALCQLRPALGEVDANLEAHHRWLDRADEAGADLVVFPELSLTGYFLKDLVPDVAMSLADRRLRELVARSRERTILFGLVEESPEHDFFNSTVLAEDGHILAVHRKVHLPDYGIFEEGRYFAAGDGFQAVPSRLGPLGILACEDAWHLPAAWLLRMQGAGALIVPSSSPARGVDTEARELSSQSAWRTLNSALALFLQVWVLHCNRVGFEDGAMFWGGSSVTTPFGFAAAEAAGGEEALLLQRVQEDPVRRARLLTPLARGERPEMIRRHLARLLEDPDALARGEDDA